jgi:predicted ester cyclase
MSTEQNKRLVRRHYEEVLTKKDLSVVDQIYAEQVRVGDASSLPRGTFKSMAAMSTQAFPDLAVTVLDQITEGDKVVTRWKATGTHPGSSWTWRRPGSP